MDGGGSGVVLKGECEFIVVEVERVAVCRAALGEDDACGVVGDGDFGGDGEGAFFDVGGFEAVEVGVGSEVEVFSLVESLVGAIGPAGVEREDVSAFGPGVPFFD